jgi:sugar O-acyltransferase (sialic acid O-acetyltransferase NeuD family)
MNLIFGASGHAAEIEWLSHVCTSKLGQKYRADYFVLPDDSTQTHHIGLPVLSESEVQQLTDPFNGFIAIGNPNLRQKVWVRFNRTSVSWPTLIHSSVIFDKRQNALFFGSGTILFPSCTLTSQINIGIHVHINVGCSISHDVIIGDFCTLSPGVRLAGKVKLSERVFLGMGAVVTENVHICSNTIIGAGAVVVRDIFEPGIYVGIPAKKIN